MYRLHQIYDALVNKKSGSALVSGVWPGAGQLSKEFH